MKATNDPVSHVPGKIWGLLSVLAGRGVHGVEEQRKRAVLAFFLMIGIATCFPFSIHHFHLGNGTRAILLLFVGSFQSASLVALHYLRHANMVFRLNVILLGTYFLFLIIVGGAHGSRILWAFIFPLFAFFLLGKKEGFFWSGLLGLVAGILFIDPSAVFGTYPYEGVVITRFFIVYAIIFMMSYIVEATTHQYYEGMERNQRKLQAASGELERRVKERTAALRNANEKLRKEIGDRKLVEERLRSSERRLADIIDFLPDATFVIDLNGKVIAWNHAIEELSGVPADEMIGKGNFEYAVPFYGQRRPVMVDLALQWDEGAVDQYEYVKREGATLVSETWNPPFRAKPSLFWNTARPLHSADGEIIGAIEVIRDITDRMVADEALQAAAQEKEIILSSLMEYVLYEDRDMKILWANRAACDSAGVSTDEIVGRYCYEIWGQRQDPCPDCPVQKAIKTGEPQETEKTTPDGRAWIIRGYPVHDHDDGITGGIEVALEITERKRAETALKEAYDIINKSPAVAFLWKNAEGWPVEFVSENVEILFGYTAEDFTSGRVSYAEVIHPEDLERVASEVSGFSSEEGRERFEHEPYRIITKDGTTKWLWDSTFIRRDPDGRITHYQGIVEDITESVATEAALRESEMRYRNFVERSFEGIWLLGFDQPIPTDLDPEEQVRRIQQQGYIAECNNAFARYYGAASREDMIGKRLLALYGREECEKNFQSTLELVLSDYRANNRETRETSLKGEEVYFLNNAVGIVEDNHLAGIWGTQRDITQEKLAAQALRESEERFREMAENIREVFWLFEWEKQNVIYVSPAYEEIWGRSMNDLYARYAEWVESIHPDDLAYAQESFDRVLEKGGGEPREYRIVRPDGTVRWILDRGFPIRDDQGRVHRIAGIAEDITERKKAEEELATYREHLEDLVEERTRALQEAQEELLKSERLAVLGQLTATVSHELRNPLGVIRSSSYYLQQRYQGQDEKIRKHMDRIEDQVEICDSIVGDLLEFTRGRHAQMVVGEINPWLTHVVNEFPETRNVTIDKVLADPLPKVLFDPEKLRRVMVNLMNNALQAVQDREKTEKDEVYQPMIQISSKETDDGLTIAVRDNGIGMTGETMERAFEPLFTTKARGTGLGLANVLKIIEEHHGTVSLRSEPRGETVVTITLPAAEEQSTDPHP